MSGADRGGASDQTGKRSRARKQPASETTTPDASATTIQECTVEPPLAERGPRAPKLVLIVDDEAPITEALALIVAEAGYSPIVAQHGMEALELARASEPALIITDLMMPRLDGAGLLAALHTDAMSNGTERVPPIILMTAADMQLAYQTGADAVLRKPFDIADVEALLERFLAE